MRRAIVEVKRLNDGFVPLFSLRECKKQIRNSKFFFRISPFSRSQEKGWVPTWVPSPCNFAILECGYLSAFFMSLTSNHFFPSFSETSPLATTISATNGMSI